MKTVMKFEVVRELKAIGFYGYYGLNVYKTQLTHISYGLKISVNGLEEATQVVMGLLRYNDDVYFHKLGHRAIVDLHNNKRVISTDKFGNLITLYKCGKYFKLHGTIYDTPVQYFGYSVKQVLARYIRDLALNS